MRLVVYQLNLYICRPFMEATLNQQIPGNTTIMDSTLNISINSVGSLPSSTETPPPGYMSEDGDPMDQNDNMSESETLLVSNSINP